MKPDKTLPLAALAALSTLAHAQPDPVELERADGAIQWPSGFPRDAEYKDVDIAIDADGEHLLYLPVTRASDGTYRESLMRWSDAAGAFVERMIPAPGGGETRAFDFDPSTNRGTYDADFVDLDGDGDKDLIHTSPFGNHVFINKGEDGFAEESEARLPEVLTEKCRHVWDDVGVGDVDADGDLDLVFANRTFGRLGGPRNACDDPRRWGPNVLVYNDGNGFFNRAPQSVQRFGEPSTEETGALEGSSHGIKMADLNNDGRFELVVSHSSNYDTAGDAPSYHIYENLGDTSGNGIVDWREHSLDDGTQPRQVGVFDFDNNGRLDLYGVLSGDDRVLLGTAESAPDNLEAASDIQFEGDAVVTPGASGDFSYDVAFGDLNYDGFMDAIVPVSDGGPTPNHVFLNDAGSSFERSDANDPVLNPDPGDAGGNMQLSVKTGDFDGDGDLDVVWGADARVSGREPVVTRNVTDEDDGGPLTDTNAPRVEVPRVFLSASREPSAVFRARITDRVVDLDEVDATLDWTATGSAGHSSSGSASLQWAGPLTYQARLACTDVRENFDPGESVDDFSWTLTAEDASGNTRDVSSSDFGGVDFVAGLGAGDASGHQLDIREPTATGGSLALVPDDGTGRLLIRVAYEPPDMQPAADQFEVTIGGDQAQIVDGRRVGNQFWLSVIPPAGAAGAHDLTVRYRLCNFVAEATETNAVVYDDDPELSDTALVLDTSGSMGNDRKMASARNAAAIFINALRDEGRVSAIRYSGSGADAASTLYGIAEAGAAPPGGSPPEDNRAAAIEAIEGVTPSGCTPIGQGLLQGLGELDSVPSADRNPLRALVLLSDGKENVPPFWNGPPSPPTGCGTVAPDDVGDPVALTFDEPANEDVDIFTVSLGPDADPALMQEIANATCGEGCYRQADVVASAESTAGPMRLSPWIATAHAQENGAEMPLPNRLANVYEHLHNGVSRQQRLRQRVYRTTGEATGVKVPRGDVPVESARAENIAAGQDSVRGEPVAVEVEPGLSYATLAVNWPEARDWKVRVVPPAGQNPAGVSRTRGSTNTVFRIRNPVPGTWRVVLPPEEGVQTLVTLSGISEVRGFARPVAPLGPSHVGEEPRPAPEYPRPGRPVPVALTLFGEQPVTDASVTGRAESRGHGSETFELQHRGGGLYVGRVSRTGKGGPIAVEVTAEWTGADGEPRKRIYPVGVALAETDSDGDGISDIDEQAHGLDPNDPGDALEDNDQDGLANWVEIATGTDPNVADTDGGGADDGTELHAGTDPEAAGDDDAATTDSDGDGLPDPWEKRFGLDPDDAADADSDTDGDGLTAREEQQAGTSPVDRDTDRDGIPDGEEVGGDTDPLDPQNRGKRIADAEPKPAPEPRPETGIITLCWIVAAVLALIALVLLALYLRERRSNQ